MAKLIDKVKKMKEQYLNEGMTDKEAIEKISNELNINLLFTKILYYLI